MEKAHFEQAGQAGKPHAEIRLKVCREGRWGQYGTVAVT
jgi:hypothetical protein